MTYTLKSFNTGQITLPKTWRERFNTKNFIAEERDGGLFIKPLISNDVVYYENKEGFGIYSENGVSPTDIIAKIQSLHHG